VSEQCRPAAVVSVDVAGYSPLMGLDESGTLTRLAAISSRIVAA
jgi:adenylate cyclase